MPTIKECVESFVAKDYYTDYDREIAWEWLRATRCENVDVHVLAEAANNLTEREKNRREIIKENTFAFLRRYFDERPAVVDSLNNLFFEFGLTKARLKEFFQLDKVYSRDEVAVLLLKHLQPTAGREQYSREDIAEYFHVSDRAINEHIRELQSTRDPNASARIFGQIVQMDPARGTNIPESTTHPVFLPLRMVELYTLVDLLIGHLNDGAEGRIVAKILDSVLNQTTEYAQERLQRIEGYDEARRSIAYLEKQEGLGDAVMFHEKEALRAKVTYTEDGEEKTAEGYVCRNHRDRSLIDVGDVTIPYRDIIALKAADIH